jgi:RecA-family ATPase
VCVALLFLSAPLLSRKFVYSWQIAIIKDVNDRIRPHQVGLIVIDTFAKAIAAGGGDENSAKDQGVCFANLARIKNATGVHVAIVGHTGKDEGRGMRGSNASYGDVDVMVEISGFLSSRRPSSLEPTRTAT